jgi:hypothetical protein
MKKIAPIAFWISFIFNIIDIGDRVKILEVIKMVDIRIILEFGLIAIMLVSGIIYLREKYKEFEKKLQSVLLVIDSAQYGAQGVTKDVTDILRSKIVSGTIKNFPVINENLDAVGEKDPAKGKRKVLSVKYTYCGEFKFLQIQEYETLSLP